MPEYHVRDPQSGKSVTLRGESPPTEQELEQIFKTVNGAATGTRDVSGLDRLVDLLPAAVGTVGGIAGGIGGTVFGIGVGGVPGAVGGATFGGASGEAAKQLINRARGKPSPETSMRALTELGKQGAIQGGTEAIGGAVTKGATTGAKAVYRGYLKPGLSERMLPKAHQIVETALAEALPIARSGSAKASALITELRTEVSNILAKTKGTIDLAEVANKVRAFAKSRYFTPGAEAADYKAAMSVADSIDQHASLGLKPGVKVTKLPASLPQADKVKRTLDTSVGETGFGVESGAAKTTKKMARHEMRTQLEAKAPAITPLNARESKLIDAAKAIRKAVEREANQNPIYGVKTIASAAVGGSAYARGDDPTTAAAKALAARMLLTPAAQSRAAIVASRIAKQLGVGAATAARLAVYAVSETKDQPQQ